ncbi:response regulator [Oscillospiraceae bacterium HV4-5-C5C]|nr:response regulator [Oscillospiraceae bacterium HV4-5-C5C]
MYKALLVDDESTVRNGLMRHLNWTALGIETVLTAASGEEGLKLSLSVQPDIVVSDIRMYEMDGVEMCRQIRRKSPDCQLIFLSGFADKPYLKAAIELAAVSFVEKPVDPAELEKALAKAVAACSQRQTNMHREQYLSQSLPYLKRRAWLALLNGQGSIAEQQRQFQLLQLTVHDLPAVQILILYTDQAVANSESFTVRLKQWMQTHLSAGSLSLLLYQDFIDDRSLVILLGGRLPALNASALDLGVLSDLLKVGLAEYRLFLAVGRPIAGDDMLGRAYQDAKLALTALFYSGYGTIVQARSVMPACPHPDLDTLLFDHFYRALLGQDENEIKLLLDQLSWTLRQARLQQDDWIRSIYYQLNHQINVARETLCLCSREQQEAVQNQHLQVIDRSDTLDDLQKYLLNKAREVIALKKREENGNAVVAKVLRFIQHHYNEPDLSVRALADYCYLTPTYFSSLFKRKTGRTVGQYLTEYRIEKARLLLRDESFKLYQVARQVGYEDSNYFARIFKKQTGLSPSEYRESQLV